MERLESETTKTKGTQVPAKKKGHFTGWITYLCRRAGLPGHLHLFIAAKTGEVAVVDPYQG